MIAVDATPLALGPPRGVARGLRALLAGVERLGAGAGVVLLAPCPLPEDVPRLGGVLLPARPCRTARAFRRRIPALLARAGAEALLVPWSAFPRTEVPVVATVHELPFVRLGPLEGRLRTWAHRRWLARNLAACAGVIVPSIATRDDLLRLAGCAGGKVHLVAPGFDPAPWRTAATSRPARGEHALLVGTGEGAAGPRKKGVDVALAAWADPALAPPIRLVVVGRLRGRVPPGVVLRDGVGDRALVDLLRRAALLVHPARSEGFGYPPLEAMAAGLPVVASEAGAIPEVVGDAALLVPPGDPAALAAAVRRVLGDEALARRLAAAGARRVGAFPPEASARATLEVLDRARRCR